MQVVGIVLPVYFPGTVVCI